jgi:hypothetical protein
MVVGFIALVTVVAMMAGGRSSDTASTSSSPAVQQTAAQQPIVQKPAAAKPAEQKPAAAKPAPTPVPMAHVGETLDLGNWRYTVKSLERVKQFPTQFGSKREAKGQWAIVRVQLTNIAKENYPINTHDFELRDADGIVYKADGVESSYYSDANKLSDLGDRFPPGVPAEVAVITDINPQAKGLQLWLVQPKRLVALE